MKKKIIHNADDSHFLTVEEAARELKIEKQSLRDHLRRGNLTTYKFKSLTLLSKIEVEAWKERQK